MSSQSAVGRESSVGDDGGRLRRHRRARTEDEEGEHDLRPRKRMRKGDLKTYGGLVEKLDRVERTQTFSERLLARSLAASYHASSPNDGPAVAPPTSAQLEVDLALDDRWPLYQHSLKQVIDLDELIGTVASKLIRTHNLSNPHLENHFAKANASTLDDRDDVIPPLPPGLVDNTRSYLDKLLTGLAIIRPPMTRLKRERLLPSGWKAVMETAGVVKGSLGVARRGHERVARMFEDANRARSDEHNESLQTDLTLTSKRLTTLSTRGTKRKPRTYDAEDDILTSILKPKSKAQVRLGQKHAAHLVRLEARREKALAMAARVAARREKKRLKLLQRDEGHQARLAAAQVKLRAKHREAKKKQKELAKADMAQRQELRRLEKFRKAEEKEKRRVEREKRKEEKRKKDERKAERKRVLEEKKRKEEEAKRLKAAGRRQE